MQTFTANLSSETRDGTWKLKIQDVYRGDIGKIDTWSLTLWNRTRCVPGPGAHRIGVTGQIAETVLTKAVHAAVPSRRLPPSGHFESRTRTGASTVIRHSTHASPPPLLKLLLNQPVSPMTVGIIQLP